MSRELNEYEVFFVTAGTLYIAEEHRYHTVEKGEYLIMPPTRKQYGYKPSFASFYWLHFTAPDAAIQNVTTQPLGRSINKETGLLLPNRGKITNIERITILLSQLQETDRRYHQEYTSNVLTVGVLMELYNQQIQQSIPKVTNKEQLYQDILDYITWNRFGMIRVSDLAAYFGYHEKYLSTFFKQMSGISLRQYLSNTMIEYAKAQLTTTNTSISQIAYSLGYSDSHNFTHAFKKVTGLTPTQYRMNLIIN
ncbi:AraC family transcriptional regulator [Anaerosporobacter faecicola]|uniref:AraC family transcriptional regulator n=1 Tax=Anaerosporobacter faecicola TaxID=2718714 RepID=UPI0014398E9B|nr:AraC family transcriptional regulator [Anaerosporobacter faecicola]